MQRCTLQDIVKTANFVPFSDTHIQDIVRHVSKQNAKGLLVRFHPKFTASGAEALEAMRDGIFVLSCPQIACDFVYTCENGGKGLFGAQKRIFKVYAGDFEANDFTASNSFKSFAIAITSINNIFRHEGLLHGRV